MSAGGQRRQLLVVGVGQRRDALRLMGHRGLEQVAHEAGVAEASRAGLDGDQVSNGGERVVARLVLVLSPRRRKIWTSSSSV